jgi:Tol biopolymer transport system component
MSGQTVYFNSGTVLVAPVNDPGFVTDRLPVITNGGGQAAVLVEFTFSAGLGEVMVVAPNGQSVKAHYTVLPGAPAAVGADPRDTTLYVGGTETFRPFIADAYGNRRPVMPVYQYRSLNGALTMSSPGKATGAAFGRGLVAVSAIGFTDTVRASVVPTGRIATQTTGAPYVIMMNLDGSNQDSLLIYLPPRSLDWSSVNHTFIMDRGGGPDFIFAMDTLGHLRQVVTGSLMRSEWYPRYSPDGSYIYFTGNDSISTCYGVWRTHQDGTALGRVVADTLDCGSYAYQSGPSPEYASSFSPDGTQLVYASRTLRVRTLGTGVDTSLGVVGFVPRWSPTGKWIAYDSLGTLMLIHPDGTGHQTLADRRDNQYPSDLFTWSPDGQWLLYHTSDRIVLVQEATGLQLPLAVTIGLFDPVWQR